MNSRHIVTLTIALATATPLVAQEVSDPAGIPGAAPFGRPAGAWTELPAPGVSVLPSLPLVADSVGQRDQEVREREAERSQRQRQRESELYDRGTEALDEGRWDRAIEAFGRVVELKGARVDGAMYWRAYAQNRQGQRAEALATVAELVKQHPESRYIKQARALELDIRNAGGQPVRPETQADDEMKLIALQSLQHSDPEEAIPMLEKLLEGTSSPRVKGQALFVLAQSSSPRAREVLRNVARGGSTPELQSRAIQYLGVHGGQESRAVLADVYASTGDADVKRRVLRAFMVAGEKERLLAAAQTEKDPDLRGTAVQQLGVMGAHDELWQLYQKESTVEVKKEILQAMFVGGNATRLVDLAKTESNPDLRRTAVRNLGLMGQKRTGGALLEIYASDKDPAIRKAVIHALFLQNNATVLVALARKEPDADMRKEMVRQLSLMTGSKEARDYMMELLNK